MIDVQQADFLRTLESCIALGTPVLLQNVLEELDPSLAPVLNKALIKNGKERNRDGGLPFPFLFDMEWLMCGAINLMKEFYIEPFWFSSKASYHFVS